MDTKIIKIDKNNIDKESMAEAADIIKSGGIVAFPTETVYGLGSNGLDEKAVEKIYKSKGRPSDNPLILHISSREELDPLVEQVPELAEKCIDKYWPGPLTIIFKKSGIIPDIISGGLDTVAVRIPDHPIALELIRQGGVPIAAPSANISGRPSPTNSVHVVEDMMGKIEMIIDGGNTGVGLESTVLDLSIEPPTILRPGGVTLEELREILPSVAQDASIINEDIIPKSPGQKYRHYAPEADMILFTGNMGRIIDEVKIQAKELTSQGKKVGIMATEESKDNYNIGYILSSGSRKNPETIASNLFSIIREFDKENVDIILAEGVELDNIGMAIMNRMIKAAGGRVIKL